MKPYRDVLDVIPVVAVPDVIGRPVAARVFPLPLLAPPYMYPPALLALAALLHAAPPPVIPLRTGPSYLTYTMSLASQLTTIACTLRFLSNTGKNMIE